MFCDVHSQIGNYPKESLANLVIYQIAKFQKNLKKVA
jgi:hypothetical protein